jgi:hypothetical protein
MRSAMTELCAKVKALKQTLDGRVILQSSEEDDASSTQRDWIDDLMDAIDRDTSQEEDWTLTEWTADERLTLGCDYEEKRQLMLALRARVAATPKIVENARKLIDEANAAIEESMQQRASRSPPSGADKQE